MRSIKFVCLSAFFGSLIVCCATALPEAGIVLHVIDQDRHDVADASAAVAGALSPNPSDQIQRRVRTDARGKATIRVQSNGSLHCSVEKEGYYRSQESPLMTLRQNASSNVRWEPWDSTVEVPLKRILQPIAMYAKRINKRIPVADQAVGFDFFEGDFVAPFGSGHQSDISVVIHPNPTSERPSAYHLVVLFPNRQDGILPFKAAAPLHGSSLRSDYVAPTEGFSPDYIVDRSRPSLPDDPSSRGLYFRVRTSVDPAGRVISSNYGKIYGDFMSFTYYLNPTPNDRNVEFDPNKNLFKLSPLDQVNEP